MSTRPMSPRLASLLLLGPLWLAAPWLAAPVLADASATSVERRSIPHTPVRHDPFARPVLERIETSAGAPGTLGGATLKGVLTTGTLRLANIDGHIVAVGDDIYGYRVLLISEHAVLLRRGEDTLTLNLKPLNGVELADGDPD